MSLNGALHAVLALLPAVHLYPKILMVAFTQSPANICLESVSVVESFVSGLKG